MAIEAPISKHTRTNFLIYIAVCVTAAIWFGYDGYINESFRQKHTNDDGTPKPTLVFNQKSPPFFLGGAVLLGAYLYVIKNKRLVAAENELVISEKERISYDSIESVDKTHFDKKGFFTITYKGEDGNMVSRRLSERKYDNLEPILNHIVAEIS